MTYILTLLFTIVLDSRSSFEAFTKFIFKLDYLYMLRSIVYVFIYEEKKKAKIAK